MNQFTAISQYHLNDGHIVFKNGVYEINDTLTTPIGTGVSIIGRGIDSRAKDDPKPNMAAQSTGQATRIRAAADFPLGKPMIRLRASEAVIDGLVLDCNGLASCGIHLDKTGIAGIYAPGKMRGSLRVENATEAAIVCGTNPGDAHCDELAIEYLQAHNCARILLVKNGQSMVHHFKHIHSYLTPIAFEYQGGGNLLVDQLTMLHHGTVLIIDEKKIDGTRSTIGSGNWLFRVNNLKCDAQTGGVTTLVDKRSETFFQATFDGGILPSGAKELIKASGKCVVTIDGYSGLEPKCIHAKLDYRKRKPNIAINRSNLMLAAKTLADLLADGAECHLSGTQNFDYHGTPIAP